MTDRPITNSPHWRWLPGMLFHPADGSAAIRVSHGDPDASDEDGHPVRGEPDLADPATLGCLLALVREAWGDDTITTQVDNTGAGWWVDGWAASDSRPPSDLHPTEADALVAALWAAP